MLLPSTVGRSPLLKVLVVVFILSIAAVSVIPNYFTGQWRWNQHPVVPHLNQLKQLQSKGLNLPGWSTQNQQVVEIGGHHWSLQSIHPAQGEPTIQGAVLLMLRPQTWYRDQPEVEWMDIVGWMNNSIHDGAQQWTTDTEQRLQFSVTASTSATPTSDQAAPDQAAPVQVKARFLRGWNSQQTYAVLQWYAWPESGDPAPSRWFWADQRSQWRTRQRMPWVAVSVLIPIEPLGDIDPIRPIAESLGKTIQATLMSDPLNSRS
jgi:cyanoexosortase B-associated protein